MQRASRSDPAIHTLTAHIVVPDADVATGVYEDAFGAVEETSVRLAGELRDPFGHHRNIAEHRRDRTPEEIDRAAAEASAS